MIGVFADEIDAAGNDVTKVWELKMTPRRCELVKSRSSNFSIIYFPFVALRHSFVPRIGVEHQEESWTGKTREG
jgi:hypothetical protein